METAINKELRIRNKAYELIINLDKPKETRHKDCAIWLIKLVDSGEITERQYHIYMADALRIEEEVLAVNWISTRIALPARSGYYTILTGGGSYTARYNPTVRKWYDIFDDEEISGVVGWYYPEDQTKEERK